MAATQGFFGLIACFTAAHLLTNLASNEIANFPARLGISTDLSSNVPPSVAPGERFSADLGVAAELPEALATVARNELGLSSIAITNS